MLKGCQKKIIHVTNTGSPYFEEAYFILRRGGDIPVGDDDMVKEALKIARSSAAALKPGDARRRRIKASIFLFGVSACSFVFGLIMLFFAVM